MGAMSDYLENQLIDFCFRGQSFTAPTTLYVGLCTGTPSDASTGTLCFECVDASYARIAVAGATGNWSATDGATSINQHSGGTSGTTDNISALTWSNWASTNTITATVICDSSTTGKGNLLWYGTLSGNKVVSNGDSFSFSANQLQIQIDS